MIMKQTSIQKIGMFVGILVVGIISIPFHTKALQYVDLLNSISPAAIKQEVQAYFPNDPVMVAIANCESGFRQYDSSGNLLRNGAVIGIFQFDQNAHQVAATALGFDITTVDGNIGYAQYLYGKEGTDPWMASYSCWSTAVPSAASSTTIATSTSIPITPTSVASTTQTVSTIPSTTTTSNRQSVANPVTSVTGLTKDLNFGIIDPEVLILQQLLNTHGYQVASSGPGSPGNETTMFGTLTRNAVRSFQCDKGITCSGSEYTTGYGLVNAATRQALAVAPIPAKASISVPFSLSRDLELGMSGTDVSALQTFLQKHNLYSGLISGTFDTPTQNAVIAFQKNYNIFPQYGYVGTRTRAKIMQLWGNN